MLSRVLNVYWEVGYDGSIYPLIKVYRVEYKDQVIRICRVKSLKDYINLNLRRGDMVQIELGDDDVAYVVGVHVEARAGQMSLPFDVPSRCPVCNGELDSQHRHATHADRCIGVRKASLERFSSENGLDLSALTGYHRSVLVETFAVRRPSDICNEQLLPRKLKRIPYATHELVDQLGHQLGRAKGKPLENLLYALAIPETTLEDCKILAGVGSMVELAQCSVGDLLMLDGISEATAKSVNDYFNGKLYQEDKANLAEYPVFHS